MQKFNNISFYQDINISIVINIDNDLKIVDDYILEKYYYNKFIKNNIDPKSLRYVKGYRYPVEILPIGKNIVVSNTPFHAVYCVDMFLDILKHMLAIMSNSYDLFYSNPLLENGGYKFVNVKCDNSCNINNDISISDYIYYANDIFVNNRDNIFINNRDNIYKTIVTDYIPEISNEDLETVTNILVNYASYVIKNNHLEKYSNNIIIIEDINTPDIIITIGKDIGRYRLEEYMESIKTDNKIEKIEVKNNNSLTNSINLLVNKLLNLSNKKINIELTVNEIDILNKAILKTISKCNRHEFNFNNVIEYLPINLHYKYINILNSVNINSTIINNLVNDIFKYKDITINDLYQNANIIVSTINKIYNMGGSILIIKDLQNKLRTINYILQTFNYTPVEIPYDYNIQ